MEAAEAVCEEPLALDYIEHLKECSMVLVEESGPEMRSRMLETLREYAGEPMSPEERAAVQRRHAGYFLTLAEKAEPGLQGPEQAAWLERLEMEYDNLRAALVWCAQAEDWAETGLRLADALCKFWQVRGHLSEGRSQLSSALRGEGASGQTAARAKALNGAGALAEDQGDYVSARALQEESLGIRRELGDKLGIAYSLEGFASLAAAQGQPDRAARLWGAAEALRQEIGSPLPPNERDKYDCDVSAAQEVLGEEAFAVAWAEGRAMMAGQVVAYALQDTI